MGIFTNCYLLQVSLHSISNKCHNYSSCSSRHYLPVVITMKDKSHWNHWFSFGWGSSNYGELSWEVEGLLIERAEEGQLQYTVKAPLSKVPNPRSGRAPWWAGNSSSGEPCPSLYAAWMSSSSLPATTQGIKLWRKKNLMWSQALLFFEDDLEKPFGSPWCNV